MNINKKYKKIFMMIMAGFVVLTMILPLFSYAQSSPGKDVNNQGTGPGSANSQPSLGGSQVIKIENPFRGGNSLYDLIKTIINSIVLPIGGVIAVLMIMYAGFLYVTAQGNPAQITKARDALLSAATGTAILLGAWVIASVIENTINSLKV